MNINQHAAWIQFGMTLLVFISTVVGGIFIFGWNLSKYEEKFSKMINKLIFDVRADTEARAKEIENKAETNLTEARNIGDQKRNRIYERFDEYKKYADSLFVRRETCGMMHQSTSGEISGLRSEISEVKNDLSKLSEKIDSVKDLLIKLNKEG